MPAKKKTATKMTGARREADEPEDKPTGAKREAEVKPTGARRLVKEEVDPEEAEIEYEEEELSSESGSEYGYASDVIEEIVSNMPEAQRKEYETLKHFHTRELMETKRIVPLHHRTSQIIEGQSIPKVETGDMLAAAAAGTSKKQLIIKIKPAEDEFLKKYLNPYVKTEEEERIFPSVPEIDLGSSDSESEEEDVVIRDAKTKIVRALEELEDLSTKQAKVYKRLRKELCLVDASNTVAFQEVAESLLGPSMNLPSQVTEYLTGLEPRDVKKAIGTAHLLMGRLEASKTGAKAPSVEDVANLYGVSAREIYEVKRGTAYLGGNQK